MASVSWLHRVQQQQGSGRMRIMTAVKHSGTQYFASQLCTATTRLPGMQGRRCHVTMLQVSQMIRKISASRKVAKFVAPEDTKMLYCQYSMPYCQRCSGTLDMQDICLQQGCNLSCCRMHNILSRGVQPQKPSVASRWASSCWSMDPGGVQP